MFESSNRGEIEISRMERKREYWGEERKFSNKSIAAALLTVLASNKPLISSFMSQKFFAATNRCCKSLSSGKFKLLKNQFCDLKCFATKLLASTLFLLKNVGFSNEFLLAGNESTKMFKLSFSTNISGAAKELDAKGHVCCSV